MLKSAVESAEPGGWVLPFVECGETMCALLEDLDLHAPGDAFAARILSAFPTSKSTPSFSSHTQALEVLTGREFEVLELLAQRYRDKEIAEELVSSPATVKRHASNIYQKLHVKERRQGVAVATSMGILSSDDR